MMMRNIPGNNEADETLDLTPPQTSLAWDITFSHALPASASPHHVALITLLVFAYDEWMWLVSVPLT